MQTFNLTEVLEQTKDVTLVAATKYATSSEMEELLDKGINNFGENRVDAFLEKYSDLRDYDNIIWHFIGTLQTNKVAKMINKVEYLHSLDNYHLAKYIEKYRIEPLKCFIQVNITKSNTKHGMAVEEVVPFLEKIKDFKMVNVIGLMTMLEDTMLDDEKKESFKKLRMLRDSLNKKGYSNITELSMGMSSDYLLALKEGATYVRLGRILWR